MESTLPARTFHHRAMSKPYIYHCFLPEKRVNCIVNAYPLFPASSKESVKAQFCINMMSSHLRNTDLSGWKVQVEVVNIQGLLVYCVTVESQRAPEKLDLWVEKLHREWFQSLKEMAASTFSGKVQSFVKDITKVPEKPAEESWTEILKEQYAFSRGWLMTEEVQKLE